MALSGPRGSWVASEGSWVGFWGASRALFWLQGLPQFLTVWGLALGSFVSTFCTVCTFCCVICTVVIQEFGWDSGIWGFRNSGVQEFGNHRTAEFGNSGIQNAEYRISGLFWSSRIREFRNGGTGIREFRNSGIEELRN